VGVLCIVRFWPQHIVYISFCHFRHRLNHDSFPGRAFQKAGAARESKPAENPFNRIACNKQRGRSRNPNAQTVKAVEQLPSPAFSERRAKMHDQIDWAVLARKQMGYSPRCEDSKDES
jgi:hypothetical protein